MNDPSIRFNTLVIRECYRFLRLFRQTIIPPVITTLLFILIFGYSLGDRITNFNFEGTKISYIVFILPGLASMGVITNSYANTSTSLYMARMDLSIENLIASPLSNTQLVSSLVLGGLLRGMVVGILTLAVALPMTPLYIEYWPLVLLVLGLTSILFSCLGIISALWSEGWDQIATFTNFVITPFVYLGGVFYSVEMLPGIWSTVSLFNPIYYLVDSLRFAVLGVSDQPFALSLSILVGLTALSYSFCVYLFKRGYKLVK